MQGTREEGILGEGHSINKSQTCRSMGEATPGSAWGGEAGCKEWALKALERFLSRGT